MRCLRDDGQHSPSLSQGPITSDQLVFPERNGTLGLRLFPGQRRSKHTVSIEDLADMHAYDQKRIARHFGGAGEASQVAESCCPPVR